MDKKTELLQEIVDAHLTKEELAELTKYISEMKGAKE